MIITAIILRNCYDYEDDTPHPNRFMVLLAILTSFIPIAGYIWTIVFIGNAGYYDMEPKEDGKFVRFWTR